MGLTYGVPSMVMCEGNVSALWLIQLITYVVGHWSGIFFCPPPSKHIFVLQNNSD